MATTTVENNSQNKIQTIKAIRAIYGCGLKDAKDIVDAFHDRTVAQGKASRALSALTGTVYDAREAGLTDDQIYQHVNDLLYS